MTQSEPFEDQLGQVHLRKQGHFLSRLHFNPRKALNPAKNKLKAIQTAKASNDIKTICSFVGLCNFFRMHIKDFAVIAASLFKLTWKDSGYKGGPLPKPAMDAFINL